MKVDKIKKRDRERTKGKILKAVGEVIEQHGTEKVGVNLIARTAGVNKVLIYRYFNSVDGLMEEYVKSGEYTSTYEAEYFESIPNLHPDERSKALTSLMHTFMNDLRARKSTRDLLRWEIGTGKSMLSDARNQVAKKILEKIGDLPNYNDTSALIAFLSAGIYFLAISADYREKMLDVDLHSDEGWKRIENIIERIITDVKS
ncbi:TetR/AcrR family transcriptional regulator [Dyadobacter sediminis]|uniref:TetR/AcrR family transcriptional regulator n=1 Tax=Dyadobacter sediminis TaxID=1493691 RepID=A0A5R9K5W4_9BACT|nr:TetR/AcrR family transcriptional regulator [Dyadobacter sediminis]TLU89034.1 TetR/AcrR family transcriptional regulator [Dyadobacter sediminis]GGC03357.1 TetR family transcriptional regulator [Dyadobacter sediminis]